MCIRTVVRIFLLLLISLSTHIPASSRSIEALMSSPKQQFVEIILPLPLVCRERSTIDAVLALVKKGAFGDVVANRYSLVSRRKCEEIRSTENLKALMVWKRDLFILSQDYIPGQEMEATVYRVFVVRTTSHGTTMRPLGYAVTAKYGLLIGYI